MTKPITHTVLILDCSGSMEGTKAESLKGFNEKVQQAKIAHESGEQEVYISLITFNGDVFEHLWCSPATEISEAIEGDFVCEGSTAMRDALGYAITKLLETTDHKNPNVSYFLEIISDGKENASKHFPKYSTTLQELIDKVEATKRWTLTYMGCDKSYVRSVAKDLHIPLENCAVWSNSVSRLCHKGLSASNVASSNFYKQRAVGQTYSAQVHSQEVGCLADYSQEEPTTIDTNLESIVKHDNSVNQMWTTKQNDIVDFQGTSVNQQGSISPFTNRSPVSWATT